MAKKKETKIDPVAEETILDGNWDVLKEPVCISEITTDFGRADLNEVVAKLNEVIRKIN